MIVSLALVGRISCEVSGMITKLSGSLLGVVSLRESWRPTGDVLELTVTGDIESRIAGIKVPGSPDGEAVRGIQVPRYSSSSDPAEESDREMRRGDASVT